LAFGLAKGSEMAFANMFSSVGHAFSGAAGAASGAASDRSAPGGHSLFSNLGITYVGQKYSHNQYLGKTSTTEWKELGGRLTQVTSGEKDGMTTQIYESEGVGTFKMQNGRFTAGSLDNFQVSTMRQKAFSHLGSIVSAHLMRHDRKDSSGLDDKTAEEVRETFRDQFSKKYTSVESFMDTSGISRETAKELHGGISAGLDLKIVKFEGGGGMQVTWKDSKNQAHSVDLKNTDEKNFSNIVDKLVTTGITGNESLQSALTKSNSIEVKTAANDATSVTNAFSRGDWSVIGNNLIDQGYTKDEALAEIYRIGDLSLENPDLAYNRVKEIIGDTTQSFRDRNTIDVPTGERALWTANEAGKTEIKKEVDARKKDLIIPAATPPAGGKDPEKEVKDGIRDGAAAVGDTPWYLPPTFKPGDKMPEFVELFDANGKRIGWKADLESDLWKGKEK
jgi:hypothetical protein